MKIWCLPLLVFASACCTQGQHIPEADAIVEAALKSSSGPGAAVAVISNGKVVHAAGYGLANVRSGEGATNDTIFHFASLSKMFTSAAVQVLAREGKLSLSDPARKHLPELPESWSGLTIEHLLSHRGGVADYTKFPNFQQEYTQPITREALLQKAVAIPLEFTPGKGFAYSNTGYVLFGIILERVSGKPLDALLNEKVFKPAGMKSARLETGDRARGTGYSSPKGAGEAAYGHPSWSFAAGSVTGTALDLAHWDIALSKGSVLTPEELARSTEPLSTMGRGHYGRGFLSASIEDERAVGHIGSRPGFSATYMRFPERGLAVIALVNSSNGNSDSIALALAKHFLRNDAR